MLITIIILAVVVFYAIMVYNRAVSSKEAVINDFKKIGVQLDARGKVIDSLVNLTKKYEIHEKEIFTKLAELRAASQSSSTINGRKTAEQEIDKIIESGKINVVFENYPELKLDGIIMKNQEAIQSEEQKLLYAKSAYNNSLEDYRVMLDKFPNNIILGVVGSKFKELLKEYEYWTINAEERKVQEEKRMSFE